jgi:PKD repeat protein
MRLNAIIVFVLLTYLGFGCKKPNSTVEVSVYDFSWTTPNDSPVVNEGISFRSTAPVGSKLSWDFGDGSFSGVDQPFHSYSVAQAYTISLTINNDRAHAVKKVIDVKNGRINHYFYHSGTAIAGDTIFFTTNTVADSSFLWDFGDGTTSVEPTPFHIYSVAGVFEVRLNINNVPAQASGGRYLTIYADSGYTRSVLGIRQWHSGKWSKYFTLTPDETKDLSDTVSAIKFIDPSTISIFGYNLKYSPKNSTSNVLVFSAGDDSGDKLYDYQSLYYNIAKDSASSYYAHNGGTKYPDRPFSIVITYTSR